jgi:hypothetical protein
LLLDVLTGDALGGTHRAGDGQADQAESTPLLGHSAALGDHLECGAQGVQRLGDAPALRADRGDRAIQRGEGRADILERWCGEGFDALYALGERVVVDHCRSPCGRYHV